MTLLHIFILKCLFFGINLHYLNHNGLNEWYCFVYNSFWWGLTYSISNAFYVMWWFSLFKLLIWREAQVNLITLTLSWPLGLPVFWRPLFQKLYLMFPLYLCRNLLLKVLYRSVVPSSALSDSQIFKIPFLSVVDL